MYLSVVLFKRIKSLFHDWTKDHVVQLCADDSQIKFLQMMEKSTKYIDVVTMHENWLLNTVHWENLRTKTFLNFANKMTICKITICIIAGCGWKPVYASGYLPANYKIPYIMRHAHSKGTPSIFSVHVIMVHVHVFYL